MSCQEETCDTCGRWLSRSGHAPFVCDECRVFWGICFRCGDNECFHLAPVVGFGRGNKVTMVELPVLSGNRYYELAQEPPAIFVCLCGICGHMERWYCDDRADVVAEDFADPKDFTILVAETERRRNEAGKPPPSEIILLRFRDGTPWEILPRQFSPLGFRIGLQ